MAELEATLELSTDDALSKANELGTTLDTALTDAPQAFGEAMSEAISSIPPLELEANTDTLGGDITAAIDAADTTVAVDADSQALTDDISGAIAGADTTVDLDTSDAQAQVDELGDALAGIGDVSAAGLEGLNDALANTDQKSEKAGVGLTHFGAAGSTVGGIAALAQGQVGGLSSIVESAGAGSFVAGAGIAALGTALYKLGNTGVEVLGTMQRFHDIVGVFGDDVKQINVGSLNADLGDLAISLGTDDEALTDTASTLFQFGQSFEATGQESADFTDKVIAMAARAVALNPALGDVASVADRMIKVFATGRDKALIPYNIALDKTEITTRALEIAQAHGREEASRFDTAVATATLSAEKYGDVLATDVAKGTENAAIQQKALGEELQNVIEAAAVPLAPAFLKVLKESIPIVEQFATAMGAVGEVALPVVVIGLEGIAAVIEPFADGISFLVDTPVGPILLGIGAAAVFASIGFTAAAGAVIEFTVALATNPIFLAITAITALGVAVGLLGDDSDSTSENVQTLIKDVNDLGKQKGLQEFVQASAIRAFSEDIDFASAKLKTFQDVARSDTGAAQLLLDAMEANGESTKKYRDILDKTIQRQEEHTRAQGRAKDAALDQKKATEDNTKSAEDAVGAFLDEVDAQNKLRDALQSVNDQLLAQFDHQIAAERAQLSAKDAVDKLTEATNAAAEAGGTNAEANEDQAKALLDAEDSALRAAAAVAQKASDDNAGLSPAEQHRAATDAQVEYLGHLADTLAPGSELRTFIEQYISRLLAIPENRHTDIVVSLSADNSVALEKIAEVKRALIDAGFVAANGDIVFDPNMLPGQPAAEGAVVQPRPGGSQWTVGEGGHTEAILSAGNTPAENMALLARAGITLPGPPDSLATRGAPAAPVPQTVDQSVHTIVHAEGQPDPTLIGIAVSRRQRADLNARSSS